MTSAITAFGTANPPYKRKQQETAELICNSLQLSPVKRRILKSVYNATGIDYRHSVLSDYCSEPGKLTFFPNEPDAPFPSTAKRMQIYKENALPLALSAIQQCLVNVDKSQITHLITVSCTGMYAPGLDIELVNELNLNSTVARTAVNFMGCYGAFNGIKVADAICRAHASAKVLVVCVELCTIHFQNNFDLDNIIANAIFSDGAAAVLIESAPETNKYLSLETFHCDLLPNSHEQMAWHIADLGFDIVLSSYVPDTIANGIAVFMDKLKNKHLKGDFDFYAIHPGGIKILEACEQALNLAPEANAYAYDILKKFGNMSSATILFLLKSIFEGLKPGNTGQTIMSCAFGPGLTLESMVLKVACF